MNLEELLEEFESISEEMLEDIFTDHPNFEKMQKSFEVFEQIVSLVKEDVPILTLDELEAMFDYDYMFETHIDDLTTDYSLEDRYEDALEIDYKVLEMFEWPDHTDNEIRTDIVMSLLCLGQSQKALDYAQSWYDEDHENLDALAMLVNAKVDNEEYDEAKLLVQPYVDQECSDETELLLRAALELYEDLDDKKMCRKLNKKIKEYEKRVNEELMGLDDEDDLCIPFFS